MAKRERSMARFTLTVVLTIVLTIVALSLIVGLFSSPDNQDPITLEYGQFMDQVKNGNIDTLEVDDYGTTKGKFIHPVGGKITFHTKISSNSFASFAEKIKEKNENAKVLKTERSPFGELVQFLWPILILGGFLWFILKRVARGPGGIMAGDFAKSRTTTYSKNGDDKVTFQDVAGVEEAKEELREIVEFLKDPNRFTKVGGRIPKGVLLVGPPGTGKTLLAKAVAGEADVEFISTSGSNFVEMFAGVGASRVRGLFAQGHKKAPCIIFIDEIDAVGRQRGGVSLSHEEREQTLNQLLAEMDGFNSDKGVIVIAATNRPDILDSALLRPGRFDRQVFVDKPDVKGRLAILEVHTKKVPLDPSADLSVVARGTVGFTGADLANLVNEAALMAGRENSDKVTLKHLEWAKDKVLMGTERKSMIISPEDKRVTAYHEAGHAVVALFMPESDPVHKVTIIPRGLSLGSTHQLPTSDKYNFSKTNLKSKIAVLMAGRVAEEIFTKQFTTGASNDIEKATDIATRMVCEWGMSRLGPIKFSVQPDSAFGIKQLHETNRNCSDDTSRKIDDMIKQVINVGIAMAKDVLDKNRALVERIASLLIEKETLEEAEIKALINEI